MPASTSLAIAVSWSLRLAIEFRMPRSLRASTASTIDGRRRTSSSSSRVPSQSVPSRSHTTHFTEPRRTSPRTGLVVLIVLIPSLPVGVVGDRYLLELGAALDDLHDLRVPVVAARPVPGRAAAGAVYLDGVGGGLRGGARRLVLGDPRGHDRVRVVVVLQPSGGLVEKPPGARAHDHVADHPAHELVVPEGTVAMHSPVGVRRRELEASLNDPDRAAGDAVAADVERADHDALEREALRPEQGVAVHTAVVEADLRQHARAGAEGILDRRDRHALAIAWNEEGGDPPLGPPEHEIQAGDLAAGDPDLGAVQLEAAGAAASGGSDRGRIAAGTGLGQAERGGQVPLGERRQPAVALDVVAPALDRRGHHRVDGEEAAQRGASAPDLLVQRTERGPAHAVAAGLARQLGAPPAVLGHKLEHVLGDVPIAVEAVRPG